MSSAPAGVCWILVVLSLVLDGPLIAGAPSTMKIRFTIDGKALDATVLDNATTWRACLWSWVMRRGRSRSFRRGGLLRKYFTH